MLESVFQKDLIKKLKLVFPSCIVLKNDPNYIQGMPDLTIIYGNMAALLECKRSEHEHHQPNQDYYVNFINEHGGFAAFVYPSNEEKIILDLQSYFNNALIYKKK